MKTFPPNSPQAAELNLKRVLETIQTLNTCLPTASGVQAASAGLVNQCTSFDIAISVLSLQLEAVLCWLGNGGVAVDCNRPWPCTFLQINTGANIDHNLIVYDPMAQGFNLVDLVDADFDIWFNSTEDTTAHVMSFLTQITCPVLTTVGGTLSCVLQVSLLSLLTPLLATVGVDLNINSNTHLTGLDFSSLVSVGGSINVGAMLNPSILFPVLTTVGVDMSIGGNVVAEVDISALTSFSGNFDCSDSALPSEQVNNILIKLDALGLTGKTVSLIAGTNGPPTGAGITAVANLVGRGCTVTTN